MKQNPSWNANISSASHVIPHILWYQKVHYCVDKSQPIIPNLSQINSVHAPSYFLKIHFNIILSCTTRSSNCYRSLTFPHRSPVCTTVLPIRATCPALSFFIWSPGYLMWSANCEASHCNIVTQHAGVRLCAQACVGFGGCVLTARKKTRSNDESHQSSHTAKFVTQLIGHGVVFACSTGRWRYVVSRSWLSRCDGDTRFQSLYKMHENACTASRRTAFKSEVMFFLTSWAFWHLLRLRVFIPERNRRKPAGERSGD
jgi:hypothetical protein